MGIRVNSEGETKMTIVCLYIECKDQAKLEQLLHDNDYAFYDATDLDKVTKVCTTMEEIEILLEDK